MTGRIIRDSLHVGTLTSATVSVLCLYPHHSFLTSWCLLDKSKTLNLVSAHVVLNFILSFFQANWICISKEKFRWIIPIFIFFSIESVMSVILLFVCMWTNFTTWQHSWNVSQVDCRNTHVAESPPKHKQGNFCALLLFKAFVTGHLLCHCVFLYKSKIHLPIIHDPPPNKDMLNFCTLSLVYSKNLG